MNVRWDDLTCHRRKGGRLYNDVSVCAVSVDHLQEGVFPFILGRVGAKNRVIAGTSRVCDGAIATRSFHATCVCKDVNNSPFKNMVAWLRTPAGPIRILTCMDGLRGGTYHSAAYTVKI